MRLHPAVRFLLAGAALFAAAQRAPSSRPPAPLPAAERGVDDLLADAALARGMDRDDPVVQRRLVRNMAFLDGDGCDAPALYRAALDLGMDRSDLVVRRRLAQRMRLAIEADARAVEPSDDDLATYLADHAEQFALPPRASVRQVFLSQRRGAALTGDARRVRAQLSAGAAADQLGDALPLPAALHEASAAQLAAWLGPAVADAAFALPLGVWSEPVASPYGVHLLRVDTRLPAAVPSPAAIRPALREAWLEARAAAAVDAAVDRWRAAPLSLASPGGDR
jgi:hypothetical protein